MTRTLAQIRTRHRRRLAGIQPGHEQRSWMVDIGLLLEHIERQAAEIERLRAERGAHSKANTPTTRDHPGPHTLGCCSPIFS